VPVEDIRVANATNIGKLELGMSRQKVVAIMSSDTEQVREGVYLEQMLVGYIDLTVANPYRSESVDIGTDRFEILYYYARPCGMGIGYWDTQFEDRTVPDWFLTPVVLENGKLVGWGTEVMEREGLIERPPGPVEDESLYIGS